MLRVGQSTCSRSDPTLCFLSDGNLGTLLHEGARYKALTEGNGGLYTLQTVCGARLAYDRECHDQGNHLIQRVDADLREAVASVRVSIREDERYSLIPDPIGTGVYLVAWDFRHTFEDYVIEHYVLEEGAQESAGHPRWQDEQEQEDRDSGSFESGPVEPGRAHQFNDLGDVQPVPRGSR